MDESVKRGAVQMKISIDNALGMMPEALSLRAQRTNTLANNIANSDTPGFKARDIDFHSVLKQRLAQSGSPGDVTRTHSTHLEGRFAPGREALQYRTPLMPSLDGNTVDTQLEQAEFAENSIQFLTALRFVNGKISGLRTAIKGE